MHLRRLYRTIESFASDQFRTDKELLKHVVNEIVKSPEIEIKGGRIWQYEPATESYKLVHQIGQIERLEAGYRLAVANYPMFQALSEQRSILANETDDYLLRKGIIKYSATGVGEKASLAGGSVFQYVLAFNYDALDQSILSDLNIISIAVTSSLRNRRIQRKAEALERDIDKARDIQQSVLPEPGLKFHHYEVFGVSEPARIVGGDFFDYLTSDEDPDRLSIVVGDAASKGFSAAAQALYLVGGVRMGFSHNTKISTLMTRLNRLLHRSFTEEQFVSLFYLELTDNARGVVLYANAGHNSPLVWHEATGAVEELTSTGQLLGPFPAETFRVENAIMSPGDMAVIYTDGISEARDPDGRPYGEPRLESFLRAHHGLAPREFCERLMTDVRTHEKLAEPADDKTVVVVKRMTAKPAPPPAAPPAGTTKKPAG